MLGFLSRYLHKAKKVDFIEVNQHRKKSLENLGIADQIFSNEEFLAKINKLKGLMIMFLLCLVYLKLI